ncbi:DUF6355 family natural product biosynthesis protein [Actinosynnema sp. CS-041913]|uniref:DUF6355 family natural product biosynthesis protein n=1 Tax=Actinosynnema sp. CS-041913 TaxID=3239917 RepID=UPI003D937D0E
MSSVIVATLAAALMTVAPPSASANDDRLASGCGFVHVNPDHNNGAVSRYSHCVDSFILIRVDIANGKRYGACVGPWGTKYYWPQEQVANAYYVTTPPRLLVVEGRVMCSLTQPEV